LKTDVTDMTKFGSFDNSTSNRVLWCVELVLKTIYLRIWQFMKKWL